jgi:hypothetical protein
MCVIGQCLVHLTVTRYIATLSKYFVTSQIENDHFHRYLAITVVIRCFCYHFYYNTNHVRHVLRLHAVALRQVVEGGDGLQPRRAAVNKYTVVNSRQWVVLHFRGWACS